MSDSTRTRVTRTRTCTRTHVGALKRHRVCVLLVHTRAILILVSHARVLINEHRSRAVVVVVVGALTAHDRGRVAEGVGRPKPPIIDRCPAGRRRTLK